MGKRVLITGGNKGIGIHITRLFLENDDQVVVVARDFKDFEYEGDPRVTAVPYDLSDTAGIPELVRRIGEIDILINNAGISTGLSPEQYTDERRQYITNINLAAPIALITQYLPAFKAKGAGRVVSVASQAGVFGNNDIWYGALKAGLINATKTFAALYGRHGLVVNAVSPGPVNVSVITESSIIDRYERIKNRTILKRYAEPDEVARVVYWLAKESPEYINGENFMINNGVSSLDA